MLALPGLFLLFPLPLVLIQFPPDLLRIPAPSAATPPDIYLDSPRLLRAPRYMFGENIVFFPLSSGQFVIIYLPNFYIINIFSTKI